MVNGKNLPRIALLLLTSLLSPAVLAGGEPSDTFPLEKGTYWIYRGTAEFLVPKKNPTAEEKQKGIANQESHAELTWKMEVVDTLERPNLFAALIKGGPWDLAWYRPGKPRGDYVILRVGKLRYYQYGSETALKLWKQLQASDTHSYPSDIEEGELILDFPLAPGKVFGGDFSAYLRSRYCWVVDGEIPLNAKRFSGAEKFPKSVEYSLSFRTNPDHVMLDFATGVGITGYVYGHHGTLSKAEFALVATGKAQPGGNDQTGSEKSKKPVVAEIVSEDEGGGNVRVIYEDGTTDLWTHNKNCTNARVAPDGTVGWIVTEAPEHSQGPGAADVQKLVVFRKGRIVAKLEPAAPRIDAWDFTPKGDKAVLQTGGPQRRLELFDIASGKRLQSVPDSETPPTWARGLDRR